MSLLILGIYQYDITHIALPNLLKSATGHGGPATDVPTKDLCLVFIVALALLIFRVTQSNRISTNSWDIEAASEAHRDKDALKDFQSAAAIASEAAKEMKTWATPPSISATLSGSMLVSEYSQLHSLAEKARLDLKEFSTITGKLGSHVARVEKGMRIDGVDGLSPLPKPPYYDESKEILDLAQIYESDAGMSLAVLQESIKKISMRLNDLEQPPAPLKNYAEGITDAAIALNSIDALRLPESRARVRKSRKVLAVLDTYVPIAMAVASSVLAIFIIAA